MNDIAPPYLANMFELHQTHLQGLRSSHDTTLLNVPNSRLLYGKHSFSHSAAALWNNLPVNIRESSSVLTFKSNLKTLFVAKC